MRQKHFIGCLAALILLSAAPRAILAGSEGGDDPAEWRHYGRDSGATKYSPLDQINAGNVTNLKEVWRWDSPDTEISKTNRMASAFSNEVTPLVIKGVMYVSTSLSQVAAINPVTGKTIWVYNPESYKAGRPTNLGFVHRGVDYWTDGKEERLFIGTGDSRLIAVDAKTGKAISEFGENGQVNLLLGMRRPAKQNEYAVSSPPVVCRNVVAVGSSIFDGPTYKEMSPGDVRGFDVKTGKMVWDFVSVAQEGQVGNETWEDDSWKYTGNANVWTVMSADEELGYVYLPFGTPTNDWYGGHRHGNGLFGETLVCVEAATGKRIWHFQTTHHGLWDYDLPAAPTLIDITVDGKKIKAVAQVTKHGFTFVLDRVTGKPVWPIEERPVPQSKVPGEKTSPTQPFPTKPPAYERQGVTEADIIDFTPELHAKGLEILKNFEYGPLFTPPSEKGTINLPGWAGGANYGGACFDPETHTYFIPSITSPIRVSVGQPDQNRSDLKYVRQGSMAVPGPDGLPLFKPPYGRVTAINMDKGEFVWQVPLGDGPRDNPAIKDLKLGPLGTSGRGYPMLTKTLLFVAQEGASGRGAGGEKPALRALDKKTGKVVWEWAPGVNTSACPITYMVNGKQFVALSIGGGRDPQQIVAMALP